MTSLSTVDVMAPLVLYIAKFLLKSNKLKYVYRSFKCSALGQNCTCTSIEEPKMPF